MMSQPETKDDLLAQIDATWQLLSAFIDGLSEEEALTAQDDAGWSVKDHLVHLAAWERSVLFMLRGEPRHAGLGIAQALYDSEEIEAVNAAIVANGKGQTLSGAVADLADIHRQLVAKINEFSDEELQRRYREFLPEEPDDDRVALDLLWGNSAHHIHEHVEWMQAWLNDG